MFVVMPCVVLFLVFVQADVCFCRLKLERHGAIEKGLLSTERIERCSMPGDYLGIVLAIDQQHALFGHLYVDLQVDATGLQTRRDTLRKKEREVK